jgi:hypothetical protein
MAAQELAEHALEGVVADVVLAVPTNYADVHF